MPRGRACRRCRSRLAGHGRRTRRDRRAVQIQRRGLRATRRGLWSLRRADGTRRGELVKDASALIAGAIVPVAIMFAWMAGAGALKDLSTPRSTTTCSIQARRIPSRPAMLQYLMTFPIRQARLDSLWFLGGARVGCADYRGRLEPSPAGNGRCDALLLVRRCGWWPRALRSRSTAVADCLSTFCRPTHLLRSPPALPPRGVGPGCRPLWRTLTAGLLVIAVLRIANFEKVQTPRHTIWLTCAARSAGEQYLSRFGRADSGDRVLRRSGRGSRVLSPRAHPSGDRPLVFGFSPWALVGSGRVSASRFFWSRPVIIGFRRSRPATASQGLIGELNRYQPPLVVLQERDWDPDGPNSADFFLANHRLAAWLHDGYEPAGRMHNFQLWRRRP